LTDYVFGPLSKISILLRRIEIVLRRAPISRDQSLISATTTVFVLDKSIGIVFISK
jgi:hypothetical protein